MATQPDRVNAGAIATLIALVALATLGVALGVTALVRAQVGEVAGERDASLTRPYRDMVAEQEGALMGPPTWVDRGKGTISIPIERAMKLTAEDLTRNPALATPGSPPEEGMGGAPSDGGAEEETTEREGATEGGNAPAPEAPAPKAPAPEVPAPKTPAPKAPPAPAPTAPPAPAPTAPPAPAPQQ